MEDGALLRDMIYLGCAHLGEAQSHRILFVPYCFDDRVEPTTQIPLAQVPYHRPPLRQPNIYRRLRGGETPWGEGETTWL
jgi:hypothetical protein